MFSPNAVEYTPMATTKTTSITTISAAGTIWPYPEICTGQDFGQGQYRQNLEEMGIRLDADNLKRVTDKVIELADKKETVTSEDLPYILSDVLKSESIFERITLKTTLSPMRLGCVRWRLFVLR